METQKYFVKQLSLKGTYNGNRYFNADFYYDLKRVISASGMLEGCVLIAFPARQKNGSLSVEDLTACLDGFSDAWVVGRFIHTMRRQIGDTVFNADSLSVNISEVSIENALQTAAKICERLNQNCAFLKRCNTSELYVIRRYDAKSESTDGKKIKNKERGDYYGFERCIDQRTGGRTGKARRSRANRRCSVRALQHYRQRADDK